MREVAKREVDACEVDAREVDAREVDAREVAMREIAIIGGGASGLAAAISAARACNTGTRVVIYEAFERVGRPILATGNGRCNFTNAFADASLYRNASFVRTVFDAAAAPGSTEELVDAFFSSVGLVSKTEDEGRKYPACGKASAVVDVLRFAAARAGVACELNCAITQVVPPTKSREEGGVFTLVAKDGRRFHPHAVIFACGGEGVRSLLEVPGVAFAAQHPVLGPLKTNTEAIRSLDGVRVHARVHVLRGNETIASEEGELLFRKYGVSGICIFNLSRFTEIGDRLVVNFVPDIDDFPAFFARRYRQLQMWLGGEITLADMFHGFMLNSVAEVLLDAAGLQPSQVVDQAWLASPQAALLCALLKAFPLEVKGVEADQCQVKRGGIQPSCMSGDTLAVSAVPGLFAAGECVDVDAPCGGYNLHWAWVSGMVAGEGAARFCRALGAPTSEASASCE